MTYIQQALAFLLGIGPLIIFHEFGHYIVARLCGVKVLRFSIGFGKVLWSRKFGKDQTEWAISAIPLGGYVKMLDNRDPATAAASDADRTREFASQSVWKRIAIIAAGPIANFILAILIFWALFMHGVEDASTSLRFMPETTPAYVAGVREGDRVLTVNGEATPGWSDLHFAVLKAAMDKDALELELEQRDGVRRSVTLPPAAFAGLSLDKDVMRPLGLMPRQNPALVSQLPEGPAKQAGVQVGDQVRAIDGRPVRDRVEMIDMIRASGGKPLTLSVLRDGRLLAIAVTPRIDPVTKLPAIGAALATSIDMVVVAVGPVAALSKAVRGTWDKAILQLKMIGKIFTGAISWKNVTGPITMADYAQQTISAGAVVFLAFVATVSISLGVMNLLPIPVLDGGLLLYYSVEVLTGRPLPEQVDEYVRRLGVVMLVMLMMLAIFNDIARRL